MGRARVGGLVTILILLAFPLLPQTFGQPPEREGPSQSLPSPDEPGPFKTGTSNSSFTDRYGMSIDVLVFYPATSTGDNAPADKSAAPYPALTFGHGFTLNPPWQWYKSWGLHWASWGYVVAMPDLSPEVSFTSPFHAKIANVTLDALAFLDAQNTTSGSRLEGMINVAAMGSAGHSMGAKAAILAAEEEARLGLSAMKLLAPFAMSDGSGGQNQEPSTFPTLGTLRLPLQVQCGDKDGVAACVDNSVKVYDGKVKPPRQEVTILGANHNQYPDRDPIAGDNGAATIARAEQQRLGLKYSTAFFEYYLKRDQSFFTYLFGAEADADVQAGRLRNRFDLGGGGGITPVVTMTDPTDGAVGVPLGSNVEVSFNTSMNRSATEGALSSSPSIVGPFTWSSGDTKVTWDPSTDLTAGAQYTVAVSTAAKSATGVAMASPDVFRFTATSGGGNVPSVSATVPTDASTNVPVTTNVEITFSTPMNTTATAPAITIAPLAPGTVTWSLSDTKYALDPTTDLAANTLHTVTIGMAAKSSTGQNLPAVRTFTFTTAPGAGPTPPSVSSNSPADGELNAPLNTNIVINFDKPMDKTATEGAVTMSPNPTNQGTWTWSNGDATVTIDPTGDLQASTQYTLTVGTGAKSAQGVALLAPHSFKFTTGTASDAAPPAIVHQVPAAVDEGTPIEIWATVTDDISVATVTVSYRAAGGTTFTKATMAPGTGDEFKATIPATAVRVDKVEYYIEAIDNAAKQTSDPPGAPISVHSVAVNKKDETPPPPPKPAQTNAWGGVLLPIVFIIFIVFIVALTAVLVARRRKQRPSAMPHAPQADLGTASPPRW